MTALCVRIQRCIRRHYGRQDNSGRSHATAPGYSRGETRITDTGPELGTIQRIGIADTGIVARLTGRPAGPRSASRTARPLRVSAKDSPLPPMTTSQGLRLQSFPNTRSGLYEGHSLPNCLRLRPAYGRAMTRNPVKRRSRSDSSEPKPNARSRIKRNGISVFSSPAYRNSLWPASTRPPYPAPGSDQGLADGRNPPWAARYPRDERAGRWPAALPHGRP